ncbi:hypothetical protein BU26DRAFT_576518 [Trematosphaeria pertusa]|uniref:Uncharacterized protein n=1 Tax=Trematosphaeria pertusa TaxID=390896 RepID=A0A6A6IAR9_9PLEO|nr:uncharacterized protein BU26DRAFT_576518 [Trematosphaeria pertusa]KAF2246630.1 hypothetical protein BU26DRAFT_576518 [Trematosphaeria pertusa]
MPYIDLDLQKLYGENFSGCFDPNTRNIRTRQPCGRTHHCKKCKAPTKRSCYEVDKLHLAFCIAVNPETEIMCGERFSVDSPGGCCTHPYNHGFNLIFKEAARGMELSPEAKGILKKDADADLAAEMATLKIEEPKDFEYYKEKKKLEQYEYRMSKLPRQPTKMKASKLQPAESLKAYKSKAKR